MSMRTVTSSDWPGYELRIDCSGSGYVWTLMHEVQLEGSCRAQKVAVFTHAAIEGPLPPATEIPAAFINLLLNDYVQLDQENLGARAREVFGRNG